MGMSPPEALFWAFCGGALFAGWMLWQGHRNRKTGWWK